MLNTKHLLKLAAAYGKLEDIEEKTVSSRVFDDSKKLAAIRSGKDITVSRYNAALLWFAGNWPSGKKWPAGVPRPEIAETAA